MNTDKTVDWLLGGPPWVQYRTRTDLLGQLESDPEVGVCQKINVGAPSDKDVSIGIGRMARSSHKTP